MNVYACRRVVAADERSGIATQMMCGGGCRSGRGKNKSRRGNVRDTRAVDAVYVFHGCFVESEHSGFQQHFVKVNVQLGRRFTLPSTRPVENNSNARVQPCAYTRARARAYVYIYHAKFRVKTTPKNVDRSRKQNVCTKRRAFDVMLKPPPRSSESTTRSSGRGPRTTCVRTFRRLETGNGRCRRNSDPTSECVARYAPSTRSREEGRVTDENAGRTRRCCGQTSRMCFSARASRDRSAFPRGRLSGRRHGNPETSRARIGRRTGREGPVKKSRPFSSPTPGKKKERKKKRNDIWESNESGRAYTFRFAAQLAATSIEHGVQP